MPRNDGRSDDGKPKKKAVKQAKASKQRGPQPLDALALLGLEAPLFSSELGPMQLQDSQERQTPMPLDMSVNPQQLQPGGASNPAALDLFKAIEADREQRQAQRPIFGHDNPPNPVPLQDSKRTPMAGELLAQLQQDSAGSEPQVGGTLAEVMEMMGKQDPNQWLNEATQYSKSLLGRDEEPAWATFGAPKRRKLAEEISRLRGEAWEEAIRTLTPRQEPNLVESLFGIEPPIRSIDEGMLSNQRQAREAQMRRAPPEKAIEALERELGADRVDLAKLASLPKYQQLLGLVRQLQSSPQPEAPEQPDAGARNALVGKQIQDAEATLANPNASQAEKAAALSVRKNLDLTPAAIPPKPPGPGPTADTTEAPAAQPTPQPTPSTPPQGSDDQSFEDIATQLGLSESRLKEPSALEVIGMLLTALGPRTSPELLLKMADRITGRGEEAQRKQSLDQLKRDLVMARVKGGRSREVDPTMDAQRRLGLDVNVMNLEDQIKDLRAYLGTQGALGNEAKILEQLNAARAERAKYLGPKIGQLWAGP